MRGPSCLPLIIAAVLAISTGITHAMNTPTLTLYMFEQFATQPGAEFTNVLSAAPTGNSSSYAFGNMGVSEQVIRETASNTSKVIGRAPGWFAPNKENGIFFLQKLLTIQTKTYTGTLVVSSDFDSNNQINEFAIVGGTGSFRLARGWTTTSVVSAGLDHLSYRWDIYLCNPSSTSRHHRTNLYAEC